MSLLLYNDYKTDVDGGILQRYLEYVLPQVYQRKEAGLPFNGELLPQFGDLPPGAKSVIAEIVNDYGEAAIMADNADDIPLAEVSVTEDNVKTVAFIGGFKVNEIELDALRYAQSRGQKMTDISPRRAYRMNRMMQEKAHKLGAFGDAARGIQGFLTGNSAWGVPIDDSSFDPYDAATTADQIIAWVASYSAAVADRTNMVEMPGVLLVPKRLFDVFTLKYRSTNSDQTLLEAILKSNPNIRAIRPLNELRSADLELYGVHSSGTNKDRMILYSLNDQDVSRRFTPLRVLPPVREKLDTVVYGYMQVSGVMWHNPYSAQFVDFPKP